VTDAPLVLVVGDVIDDVIVRPLAPIVRDSDTPAVIVPTPGGSAANAAVWLAAAGARVRFVGRVGAADVARHAATFAAAGVEAHLVADDDRPTGAIVILVEPDGRRTMFTDRGANVGLTAVDLPDSLLDGVTALHVSGYALFDADVRAAVLDLVARARGRGLRVSVDPSSVAFLEAVGVAAFRSWVDGVDVLLPNRDEACLLAGTDDLDTAISDLLGLASLVACTLGPGGVAVASRHAALVRVAAVDTEVVDTTGAGDAFTGAFLAAWLAGADARTAAERGAAAAAHAVRLPGARPRS
jgi:sugar/nucleoside kinase (ribokinase family)